MHVQLVLVGVVVGIGPGDRLGSIAIRVVDVEVDSGTSGLINSIPVDLTLYSPGCPDKEVLIVPLALQENIYATQELKTSNYVATWCLQLLYLSFPKA